MGFWEPAREVPGPGRKSPCKTATAVAHPQPGKKKETGFQHMLGRPYGEEIDHSGIFREMCTPRQEGGHGADKQPSVIYHARNWTQAASMLTRGSL